MLFIFFPQDIHTVYKHQCPVLIFELLEYVKLVSIYKQVYDQNVLSHVGELYSGLEHTLLSQRTQV